jgi:hypothetical protein
MNSTDSEVFEALARGTVPQQALEAIAVLDPDVDRELNRTIEDGAAGAGTIRFLRGAYGAGKTFVSQLAAERARAAGWATAHVTLSPALVSLDRLDQVCAAVAAAIRTADAPQGGLTQIVAAWCARLVAAAPSGVGEAPSLRALAAHQLRVEGLDATSPEFAAALVGIAAARERGDLDAARDLTRWLAGSDNVSPGVLRAAGLRGVLRAEDAVEGLRALVTLARMAGFRGLMIVVDELATMLVAPRRSRDAAWRNVQRMVDEWAQWPGVLWLLVGTPDVFDHPYGFAGLTPLHQRVSLVQTAGIASTRQPQIELHPMSAERLLSVATRLRDVFPARDVDAVRAIVNDETINRLIHTVASGFGGRVEVVPRQFLRAYVDLLHAVDDGRVATIGDLDGLRPVPAPLTDEERAAATPSDPLATTAVNW